MAPPSSGSPPPSQDFAKRELPVETVPAGTHLARIHQSEYDPLYFGSRRGNRFAGPSENYGVCYMAKTIEGSFAETFVRAAGNKVHGMKFVHERSFSEIVATAPLRLLCLHGPGLARVGATSAVASGPYDVARNWSRAIHDHPAVLDGIAYRSKHDDDEICIALFDRARECVAAAGVPQPMMMDLARLAELFARYGLGLE